MKIVLASGGSGGHIIPALKVARILRAKEHEVLFVGSFGKMRDLIKKAGFPFQEIPSKGLGGNSIKGTLTFLFCMLRSLQQSLQFLKKWQPQAVCGFGGYGAFPVVFAANLLRYPSLFHEQNVVPGKANALLSRWIKRIAISFEQTRPHFNRNKVVLTGCPAHSKRELRASVDLDQRFGLEENKLTILVLGGSQGSRVINETVLQTIPLLRNPIRFQVVHMTGENDNDVFKKGYQNAGIKCYVTSFLDNIEDLYQIADLVVSRAGAVTVTEIMAFSLPSVLIPYPGAHQHQTANASVLSERQLAKVIDQNDLTPQKLKKTIDEFVDRFPSREQIRQQLKGVYIEDAAQKLAKEIIDAGK